MRQAGRSEQGRLQMVGCTLLFPRGVGWGGSEGRLPLSVPWREHALPQDPGLARWWGSLDSTMCPVIPDNRSRCREQGSQWQRPGWRGREGPGLASGRDGGEGPSVAILASSATLKLTVERGIIFQTIFKLCQELR